MGLSVIDSRLPDFDYVPNQPRDIMPYPIVRTITLLSLMSLAACGDGNPFDDAALTPPATDDGDQDSGTLPPVEVTPPVASLLDTGTTRPAVGTGQTPNLVRVEKTEGGGGRVANVRYDAANDRFIVDGLAFDGVNSYIRHDALPTLGTASVFTAGHRVPDFITSAPIGQIIPYYAVYGASENDTSASDARPRTSYAIIRTGGLVDTGPGGFLYARNGGVTLPEGPYNASSGQAVFTGDYNGLRVYDGEYGIEFVTGEMMAQIDFRETDSVLTGRISKRAAYDEQGNAIALTADGLRLPDVVLSLPVGSSNITTSGEIAGTARSSLRTNGNLETYEEGTYYGAIAGNLVDSRDGGEIVGVIVLQSTDPRNQMSVQETGGFILQR